MPVGKIFAHAFYRPAHNFCSIPVPDIVMVLLAKSLKFVPDTHQVTQKELMKATDKLVRAINVQNYFGGCDLLDRHVARFRVPRKWDPPMSEVGARTSRVLRHEFCSWEPARKIQNWSYWDRLAMKWLREHVGEIVICDSDKNMGVSLFDRSWVLQQSFQHILAVCKELEPKDRIRSAGVAANEARKCLNSALRSNLITSAETRFLCKDFASLKAGMFRLLPKLHKTPITSRPIFTAGQSWTRGIAEWLVVRLAPLVDHVPTIAKSSADVQKHLLGWLPPVRKTPSQELTLMTMDIESLYPSICLPHCKWVVAGYIYKKFAFKEAQFLVRLLDVVLYYNDIEYHGQFFRIKRGVPTGSPVSVTVANIYLRALDEFVANSQAYPLYYIRYIDDVFMICWRDEADDIAQRANLFHGSIKLKVANRGRENVEFLDLNLGLDARDRIRFELYNKPMSLFAYVPFTSAHPPFVFRGVSRGEAMRYHDRCSSSEVADQKLELLRTRLRHRGYPYDLVDHAIRYAKEKIRHHCKKKEGVNKRSLFFVCRYSGSLRMGFIKKTLKKLTNLPGRPTLTLKVQKNLFRLLYNQWKF